MPKSRAEIQKAYRERQKQKEGRDYVERERTRKRKAYIPAANLDDNALKKRRLDQKARVEKYRKEQKEKQCAIERAAEASSTQKRQTRSASKEAEKVPHLMVKKEITEFEAHAERVKAQYGQLKELKSNLPEGHMIVQMDFAENYTCQSVEEVQSAWWNGTMVTLHPAVAYFNDENGSLIHQSTVFISDELAHNSSTVYAILRKLVPELKSIVPEVKYIHYFTDSPTSQYRNKTIFHILTQHEKEFGIPASWHYFEAGHGKGPCDGVGGTTKRMADEAVKQQKATIQDADDFFLWTQAQKENSSIKYLFVSKEQCSDAQTSIDSFGNLQSVEGTMKLHAVIPVNGMEGYVAIRNTSCFCVNCFSDGTFLPDSACGWKKFRMKPISEEDVNKAPVKVQCGDWVAAVYERNWYVGKVQMVDSDANDAQISFMQQTNARPISFRWPTSPDEIWVDFDKILGVIEEPSSRGRSNRHFHFNDQTIQMITDLFDGWLSTNQ